MEVTKANTFPSSESQPQTVWKTSSPFSHITEKETKAQRDKENCLSSHGYQWQRLGKNSSFSCPTAGLWFCTQKTPLKWDCQESPVNPPPRAPQTGVGLHTWPQVGELAGISTNDRLRDLEPLAEIVLHIQPWLLLTFILKLLKK